MQHPDAHAPLSGGIAVATPQVFAENLVDISTRLCVHSQQADYGHVLIPLYRLTLDPDTPAPLLGTMFVDDLVDISIPPPYAVDKRNLGMC